MHLFSKILFAVSHVCGVILLGATMLFAVVGTLFFDNPHASYAKFVFSIVGIIAALIAVGVGNHYLMKRGQIGWSMAVSSINIVVLAYGVYYFMGLGA